MDLNLGLNLIVREKGDCGVGFKGGFFFILEGDFEFLEFGGEMLAVGSVIRVKWCR